MLRDAFTKLIVSLGVMGAKSEINTNSPLIHYQPNIPDVLNRMRKSNRQKGK